MKKTLIFIANLLIVIQLVKAQSVTIAPSDPASPTKGTVVFDNALSKLKYWDGAVWQNMGGGSASVGWATSGTYLYNTNTGVVGVGPATFNVSPISKVMIGQPDDYTSPGFSGVDLIDYSPDGTDEMAFFQNNSAANWYSSTNMALMAGAGNLNVGIGTLTPTNKLQIGSAAGYAGNTFAFGNGAIADAFYLDNANNSTQWASTSSLSFMPNTGKVGIGIANPVNFLQVGSMGSTGYSGNHVAFGNGTDASGFFQNTNYVQWYATENIVIMPQNGNGNVGIGTSNPTYKLAVNGTIRAKEVIVETNWADYVFEKSYSLPKLNDVEQFIKQNKHLPDLPSASDIQQNGAKLAELTTKMMQTIEEQMLYIIQLQKQIDDLKSLKK